VLHPEIETEETIVFPSNRTEKIFFSHLDAIAARLAARLVLSSATFVAVQHDCVLLCCLLQIESASMRWAPQRTGSFHAR
jgi:hypothetical protein